MNVQEKLEAIRHHAVKALNEIRELQTYLDGRPAAVELFDDVPPLHTPRRLAKPGDVRRSRAQGTGYVSPMDESVEWPDDAA